MTHSMRGDVSCALSNCPSLLPIMYYPRPELLVLKNLSPSDFVLTTLLLLFLLLLLLLFLSLLSLYLLLLLSLMLMLLFSHIKGLSEAPCDGSRVPGWWWWCGGVNSNNRVKPNSAEFS